MVNVVKYTRIVATEKHSSHKTVQYPPHSRQCGFVPKCPRVLPPSELKSSSVCIALI